MSTQAILERERRYRRVVAAAAILPLLLLVLANVFQGAGGGTSELATETLRTIEENSGSQLIGSAVASFAFLLLAAPLWYLFKAAQARSEKMLGALLFLVLLGPVLFAAQGVLAAIGQIDAAREFVDQEGTVGDIYSLATNLLEESGAYTAALYISSIASIGMVFGMVYTSLWGMRTGLLTRFLGNIGIVLGATFILPPLTGLTLPMLLAWFMYFGLMIAGRTPRGRPPAWDAGVAIPWPKPGEEPQPAAATAGDDVVEGDATEIPGVDENPNAARRERAKKRKRKRRR